MGSKFKFKDLKKKIKRAQELETFSKKVKKKNKKAIKKIMNIVNEMNIASETIAGVKKKPKGLEDLLDDLPSKKKDKKKKGNRDYDRIMSVFRVDLVKVEPEKKVPVEPTETVIEEAEFKPVEKPVKKPAPKKRVTKEPVAEPKAEEVKAEVK